MTYIPNKTCGKQDLEMTIRVVVSIIILFQDHNELMIRSFIYNGMV